MTNDVQTQKKSVPFFCTLEYFRKLNKKKDIFVTFAFKKIKSQYSSVFEYLYALHSVKSN